MSRLDERVVVRCPSAQAAVQVERFFDRRADADGKISLNLRVPVSLPGFARWSVHRSVVATLERHRLPQDMTPRYRVGWAPGLPGLLPLFSGELFVEGAEDYDRFGLVLRGEYAPPLGSLGAGFDALIGNRIARATGRDLLARLKDDIERDFLVAEGRKHPEVSA